MEGLELFWERELEPALGQINSSDQPEGFNNNLR